MIHMIIPPHAAQMISCLMYYSRVLSLVCSCIVCDSVMESNKEPLPKNNTILTLLGILQYFHVMLLYFYSTIFNREISRFLHHNSVSWTLWGTDHLRHVSERLILPRCTTERNRKSFLPVAIKQEVPPACNACTHLTLCFIWIHLILLHIITSYII